MSHNGGHARQNAKYDAECVAGAENYSFDEGDRLQGQDELPAAANKCCSYHVTPSRFLLEN